jgi:hypothetical protein
MGQATTPCNKVNSHRMEFARTDEDNSEGPERAKCVLLDDYGLVEKVVFKARITYNSTGGANVAPWRPSPRRRGDRWIQAKASSSSGPSRRALSGPALRGPIATARV